MLYVCPSLCACLGHAGSSFPPSCTSSPSPLSSPSTPLSPSISSSSRIKQWPRAALAPALSTLDPPAPQLCGECGKQFFPRSPGSPSASHGCCRVCWVKLHGGERHLSDSDDSVPKPSLCPDSREVKKPSANKKKGRRNFRPQACEECFRHFFPRPGLEAHDNGCCKSCWVCLHGGDPNTSDSDDCISLVKKRPAKRLRKRRKARPWPWNGAGCCLC